MAQEGQVGDKEEENERHSDCNPFISRGKSLHDLRPFKSSSLFLSIQDMAAVTKWNLKK